MQKTDSSDIKKNIHIIEDFRPDQSEQMAKQMDRAIEIFYEAFKQKITALVRSRKKAIEIHRRALNPQFAFFALLDGNIIGIAGLNYSNRSFLEFKYADIRKTFGPLKSLFYYFIFQVTRPKIGKDVLRIESIAVDKNFRGQGAGTMLIQRVLEFAGKKGFRKVILEVVDTNPKAKALYERLGFVHEKIKKYYFLTRSAGFSSEAIMSKQIT